MACGFGDDLASTTILASNKKILVAPAMNEKMWNYEANLENISKLKKSRTIFIEPSKDELACGEIGVGKMRDPIEISQKIDDFFHNQEKLKGKKVIITGGSTREMIDPVRFIGNNSSGKQAIYLTQIFSEQLNKNFYLYINVYRIHQVKALLNDPANKDMTLLDIAYESGFNSKSTFNAIFKKITNMTPTQYRKNRS